MSTHNICFRAEIRKIFTRYPPLSRPMPVCIPGAAHTSLFWDYNPPNISRVIPL